MSTLPLSSGNALRRSFALAPARIASLAALPFALALAPASLSAQDRAPTTTPITLTLQDALTRATGTSEAVAIARAGEMRASGQQAQARSALMPQLSTTLGWQKTLQNQFQAISEKLAPPPGEGGGGGGDSSLVNNPLTRIFASPYNVSFGLTGSQAVYTGGRASALVRAARAGREAAAIGTTSAQAQVQLDVTQAYFDAMMADRLVAIAESSLVQSERTLKQVQLTKQVGSASEFELIRARVTRDNQRPQFLQSRTQRDLAYQRLRQLLDLPASQPITLVDQAIENIDLTPLNAADPVNVTTVNVQASEVLVADPAVRQAVERVVAATDTSVATRAAVRQAEKAVEISKQQYRATRAQRLPTIGLVTNYQRLAYPTNGLPNSLGDFFPNWTAGVQLSFPFFTGGRVRGEELAAQAGVIEAEQQLQMAREGAALDVQQAVAQFEEAVSAWQASQGTAEQATRAYSIAEVRFREGISTQLELSETRVQLQQALANRARAARDLQVARVRLQLIKDLPIGAGSSFGGAGAGSAGSAGGAFAAPAGQQGTLRSGTNMQSGNLP